MPEQIQETRFNDVIFTKVKKGIDVLANAVKVTLGPNGKSVIIKKNVEKIITKDGVTVAKNIYFNNPYENLGAEMVKESAIRTNELAGDGTTTSTILTQKLIDLGLRKLKIGRWFFKKNKIKSIDLVDKIEKETKEVISNLKEMSRQIETEEEVIDIATISANDKETGKLIGGIYNEIKKDGLIIVEDSRKAETSFEIIDGLRFTKGYVSPYFVNEPTKGKVVLEDVYILITDLDICYFSNLIPIVNKIIEENGKNLLVMGSKITGEALMGMIQNKVQGKFQFLAVEAPSLDREEFLQDLALITGGRYFNRELGFQLVNLELQDLGRARKIICDKDSTIVVDGKGDKEKITESITLLEKDSEKNKKRLEKFKSKIAVIKVGATTEPELVEKKYRFEDAIEATKSALEEGIVVGGGVALINASRHLPKDSIIRLSCQEPFIQILRNIDKDGRKYLKDVGGKIGYDARNNKLINLYDAGIIDPLKVVRVALENAVSISTLFLKTESIVLNIKDPKDYGYKELY